MRIWETSFAASVIPALQWRNILFSWQAFWPDPVVACLPAAPPVKPGGAAPGPPAFFAFRQQHDGQACRGASPPLPFPMLLAQCVKCRGCGGGAPKRHERSQNPMNLCFGCGRRPLQGSRDPGAAGLGASRGVDSRVRGNDKAEWIPAFAGMTSVGHGPSGAIARPRFCGFDGGSGDVRILLTLCRLASFVL